VPHTKFRAEVLTPEGEVFNDEVEMVSTKTAVGSIGILANHEPLLAMLDPTELRLYRTESEVVRFAQAEGYIQMAGNHVLILVEEAVAPGDLDAGALRERLQQAERELDSAGQDTEKQRVAERDKVRLEQFLRIAER
jgi:F-type H+-transporting ATPase subunit epsilon